MSHNISKIKITLLLRQAGKTTISVGENKEKISRNPNIARSVLSIFIVNADINFKKLIFYTIL